MFEFLLIHILSSIPLDVIKPFFAQIVAAYEAIYLFVATVLKVLTGGALSTGVAVTVAKAIVDAAIIYGLYRLGARDPLSSSIGARRLFQMQPNPPRMIVYGDCWLAPTIISQTSDTNALHIICAVADHKLRELKDVRVQHQNFLSVGELSELIGNRWGLYLGSVNGDVSPARRAIKDSNHERYHESDPNFSYHPFLYMTYGFHGEPMDDDLNSSTFKNKTVRDPGRGFYNSNDFLPIKAGAGYGTDLKNYNMRMEGVSWTTISLKRLSKKLRPAWPYFPNFTYRVIRGNENLNVRFLFPKVEIGKGLGKFTKDSTEVVKGNFRKALGFPDYTSSGVDPYRYEVPTLEYEEGDTDDIKKAKDDLYKDIVTKYYSEGNAALCTADFLKNYTSYRETVIGESRIDIETTLQAAKDCEEYVDANGDVSPLTANGAMQIQRPDAVLQQLALAMNAGSITESGGIRYMYVGKAAKRYITITDDDILADPKTGQAAIVMAATSDISRRASAIDLRFIDQSDQSETLGLKYKSPTGRRIKRATSIGMAFAFINNAEQARQVGRLVLDRQWNGSTISFVMLNSLKTPKPYDVLNMQIENMRLMSSKLFRVVSVTNSMGGKVTVQAVHERPGLYNASEVGDYAELPDPDYSLDEVVLGWDEWSPDDDDDESRPEPAAEGKRPAGWWGTDEDGDSDLTTIFTRKQQTGGNREIDAATGEVIDSGSELLGNPVRIN